MALQSQYNKEISIVFGKMPRKQTKIPPKDAAPVEAVGGIFTAAVVPSPLESAHEASLHNPHLGDVLSVVKSKLADLNPIRLHRKANSRAALYAHDEPLKSEVPTTPVAVNVGESNLFSVSVKDSPSEDDRGEVVGGEENWSFGASSEGDGNTRDTLFDSCGIIVSSEPSLIDLTLEHEDGNRFVWWIIHILDRLTV